MRVFYIFLAVLLLFAVPAIAQPVPSADIILKDACTKAGKENKQVLLIFHASWCGWCRKMDNSLNDPVCKKYFDDNYITCHLIVEESDGKKSLENPGAAEWKKNCGGEREGLPYWVVLNKEKKILVTSKMPAGPGAEGGNVGCPAQKEEVAYFIEVLKRTSGLTDKQLAVISKRFAENK